MACFVLDPKIGTFWDELLGVKSTMNRMSARTIYIILFFLTVLMALVTKTIISHAI